MLRAELCRPRPNLAAVAGTGAYRRNIIWVRLTARTSHAHARGWCDTGRAWRFGGPMRSSTHRLSSVLASTYMSAQSSDSWSDRSATVAMSNRPKICCVDDSTIGNAAFLTGCGQHARRQNAPSRSARYATSFGAQHRAPSGYATTSPNAPKPPRAPRTRTSVPNTLGCVSVVAPTKQPSRSPTRS
jgi:hypothetical protein